MVLNLIQFQELITNAELTIIDTRVGTEFMEGFVPNSIHVELDAIKAFNALKIIEQDHPIVLITSPGTEEAAVKAFELLGYTQIKGYLSGGFQTWVNAGQKMDLIIEVEVDELAMDIPFDEFLMVLDIREESQFNKAHIKNAVNIPLIEFNDPGSMSELDEHFNIYLIDEKGKQNLLAASILKKQGIHNIRIVMDGWEAVQFLKEKFKFETLKETP